MNDNAKKYLNKFLAFFCTFKFLIVILMDRVKFHLSAGVKK